MKASQSFQFLRGGLAAVGLASLLAFSATAHAMAAHYGTASQASQAEREIRIDPSTQWVNVTRNETVRFVSTATGKSFVWRFDTAGSPSFDLGEIAPAGVQESGRVRVFVAPDPRYSGA